MFLCSEAAHLTSFYSHQAQFHPNEQGIRSLKPEKTAVQQPHSWCPCNNWFGGRVSTCLSLLAARIHINKQ
jgi:hypothetical protein